MKSDIDKWREMMYDIKHSLPTDGAEASGPRQGRTSRGDSGALYLQSAPAGVIPCLGQNIAELPYVSGVDVWVLRNGNL